MPLCLIDLLARTVLFLVKLFLLALGQVMVVSGYICFFQSQQPLCWVCWGRQIRSWDIKPKVITVYSSHQWLAILPGCLICGEHPGLF